MSEAAAEAVTTESSDMGGAPVESSDFQAPSAGWQESLPEPVRGWQEVETSKDADAFWDQMANMRSAIGNSLRIPSEDAGEEQWNDFNAKLEKVPGMMRFDENNLEPVYARLGKPGTPDAYRYSEVEGFEEDPEVLGAFNAMVHEANLNVDQADKIHGWLAENIAAEQMETAQAFEADMASLKGQWGAAFDHNVNVARGAVSKIDQLVPGFSDYLNESGAGNSKQFIMAMNALGQMFGESGAMEFQESTALSPAEARLQIEDIRNNPEHPYNDEMSPAHEAAKEKVRELYKFAAAR